MYPQGETLKPKHEFSLLTYKKKYDFTNQFWEKLRSAKNMKAYAWKRDGLNSRKITDITTSFLWKNRIEFFLLERKTNSQNTVSANKMSTHSITRILERRVPAQRLCGFYNINQKFTKGTGPSGLTIGSFLRWHTWEMHRNILQGELLSISPRVSPGRENKNIWIFYLNRETFPWKIKYMAYNFIATMVMMINRISEVRNII